MDSADGDSRKMWGITRAISVCVGMVIATTDGNTVEIQGSKVIAWDTGWEQGERGSVHPGNIQHY